MPDMSAGGRSVFGVSSSLAANSMTGTAMSKPGGRTSMEPSSVLSWKSAFESKCESATEDASGAQDTPGIPVVATATALTEQTPAASASSIANPRRSCLLRASPGGQTGSRTLDEKVPTPVQAEHKSAISGSKTKSTANDSELRTDVPRRDGAQHGKASVSALPAPTRTLAAHLADGAAGQVQAVAFALPLEDVRSGQYSMEQQGVPGVSSVSTGSASDRSALPLSLANWRENSNVSGSVEKNPEVEEPFRRLPGSSTDAVPHDESPPFRPLISPSVELKSEIGLFPVARQNEMLSRPVSEKHPEQTEETGPTGLSAAKPEEGKPELPSAPASRYQPSPLSSPDFRSAALQAVLPPRPILQPASSVVRVDSAATQLNHGDVRTVDVTSAMEPAPAASPDISGLSGRPMGSGAAMAAALPSVSRDTVPVVQPGVPIAQRSEVSLARRLIPTRLSPVERGSAEGALQATDAVTKVAGAGAGYAGSSFRGATAATTSAKSRAASAAALSFNQHQPMLIDDRGAARAAVQLDAVKWTTAPGTISEEREAPMSPFDAMDSAAGISQGPAFRNSREISVGVRDNDLGLLELRAHLDGAGVHASLVAPSPASSMSLQGQLHDLEGWLVARHTPVESLHVVTATLSQGRSGTETSGGEQSAGQPRGEAGGNSQQGTAEGRGSLAETFQAQSDFSGKRVRDAMSPINGFEARAPVKLFHGNPVLLGTQPHISILV